MLEAKWPWNHAFFALYEWDDVLDAPARYPPVYIRIILTDPRRESAAILLVRRPPACVFYRPQLGAKRARSNGD